jgi:hypothetical protein
LARGVRRLSGVPSSALTTAGLGSMAQRGLGGRRALMDTRRAVEPSGAVAASTAGAAKFIQILTLKIARQFAGGDGFFSEYARCSLRVW